MSKQPTYRIEITPERSMVGDQAIRSLRALLKIMLRAYGLRCVSAVQIREDGEELPLSGEDS